MLINKKETETEKYVLREDGQNSAKYQRKSNLRVHTELTLSTLEQNQSKKA